MEISLENFYVDEFLWLKGHASEKKKSDLK